MLKTGELLSEFGAFVAVRRAVLEARSQALAARSVARGGDAVVLLCILFIICVVLSAKQPPRQGGGCLGRGRHWPQRRRRR